MVGLASFALVSLLIAPLLLLPRIWRLIPLFFLDVAVSIVLMADELYFRRYFDIVSRADLASAPVLREGFARSAAIALLRPIDLVYGLDLVALLVVPIVYVWAARRQGAVPFRMRCRVGAGVLAVGLLAAVLPARLLWGKGFAAGNDAYRGEIAGEVGPLPYHLYDAATLLATPRAPALDLSSVRQFVDARRRSAPTSSLFGHAKGRNLILIQAESLQGFPIGLTIDGQPVTPRLSAFAAESLQFANFFDQTHHGYTSDGEFTALTSLHPLAGGAASVTLRTNHYRSLPAILDAQGYDTLSACAANGRVWSMAMMHPNHGFDRSLFEDRFEDREHFQLLSDGEFFSQMLPHLAAEPRPFMTFLITSSNHGPFDIPDRYRTLRLPAALARTMLGDYLQSVHYFDRVFGEFIDQLQRTGLLDETVVAIYGDHQAYLPFPEEITALAGFPRDSAYGEWITEKRIPFLVRLPHGEGAGPRATPTGHLDIAPTLLSLLGVDDEDRVMLGRDASGSAPPFVVFRDGGFADAEHEYTLPHLSPAGRPACYAARTGQTIDCAGLEADHKRALDELAVSDEVLHDDLIPALVSAPIPKTVNDLPPPKPYSKAFGTDHVVTSAFDVWAPAPSGATFSVKNDGGPVRLIFSPIIDESARATEKAGVTFEVWSGSSLLYQQHVLPQDLVAATVDVPPVPGSSRTEISLVTRADPAGTPGPHHATWQRLRFETHPSRANAPAQPPTH